jgi:hypothetical protein
MASNSQEAIGESMRFNAAAVGARFINPYCTDFSGDGRMVVAVFVKESETTARFEDSDRIVNVPSDYEITVLPA